MSRNSLAASAAVIVVAAAISLGFWNLGTPARERQIHQDIRTVQGLDALAEQISQSWKIDNKTLPANLDHFPASAKENPTTHALFGYHPVGGSRYELCGDFLADNRKTAPESEAPFWVHASGYYCFQLDALMPVARPPYSYNY